MTSFSNSNDLPTSTFPIFRTLDDTGKIKHLDVGTIILNLAGYSGKSCEFIGSHCG